MTKQPTPNPLPASPGPEGASVASQHQQSTDPAGGASTERAAQPGSTETDAPPPHGQLPSGPAAPAPAAPQAAQPPPAAPRRSRDGLAIGLVVGAAVWLPFVLFSAEFIAQATTLLFGALVTGLGVAALVTLTIYVFRDRIRARIFGNVQGTLGALADSAGEALRAWPDAERAAPAVRRAVTEGAALVAWTLARRTLVTIVFSLIGSVLAFAGTTLLILQTRALEKQNTLLDDQNTKLERQTELLDRQVQISAHQGQWEMLWKANYSSDPATRLEAAIDLTAEGNDLTGTLLEGSEPVENRFVNLSEKPYLSTGEFDPEFPLVPVPKLMSHAFALTQQELPPTAIGHLRRGQIRNLAVSLLEADLSALKDTTFEQATLFIDSRDIDNITIERSVFDRSSIRSETSGSVFLDTSFSETQIRSGLRQVQFHRCRFSSTLLSLTWGQDWIDESSGDVVLIDYHGWKGTPGTFSGIRRSRFQTIAFIWRDNVPEMRDVDGFLARTVASDTQVADILFLTEATPGASPGNLLVVAEPTDRARLWLQAR